MCILHKVSTTPKLSFSVFYVFGLHRAAFLNFIKIRKYRSYNFPFPCIISILYFQGTFPDEDEGYDGFKGLSPVDAYPPQNNNSE